jgi:hypothetical protein
MLESPAALHQLFWILSLLDVGAPVGRRPDQFVFRTGHRSTNLASQAIAWTFEEPNHPA